MQKVRHVEDAADGTVNLTIVTETGQRLEKNVKHAPGDPTFGLLEDCTLEKFRACAAYRLPARAIATLANIQLGLDQASDLTGLIGELTTVGAKCRRMVPARRSAQVFPANTVVERIGE